MNLPNYIKYSKNIASGYFSAIKSIGLLLWDKFSSSPENDDSHRNSFDINIYLTNLHEKNTNLITISVPVSKVDSKDKIITAKLVSDGDVAEYQLFRKNVVTNTKFKFPHYTNQITIQDDYLNGKNVHLEIEGVKEKLVIKEPIDFSYIDKTKPICFLLLDNDSTFSHLRAANSLISATRKLYGDNVVIIDQLNYFEIRNKINEFNKLDFGNEIPNVGLVVKTHHDLKQDNGRLGGVTLLDYKGLAILRDEDFISLFDGLKCTQGTENIQLNMNSCFNDPRLANHFKRVFFGGIGNTPSTNSHDTNPESFFQINTVGSLTALKCMHDNVPDEVAEKLFANAKSADVVLDMVHSTSMPFYKKGEPNNIVMLTKQTLPSYLVEKTKTDKLINALLK